MALPARVSTGALDPASGAYFWYVVSLRDEDARRWLMDAKPARPVLDWLEMCVAVGFDRRQTSTAEWSDVAGVFAGAVEALASADGLHETLVALRRVPVLRGAVPLVARWLARVATAGDAGVIAEWLDAHELVAIDAGIRLELEIAMLERGFSELRRSQRLKLSGRILSHIDATRPDLRARALRMLLHNESAGLALGRQDDEMSGGVTDLGIEAEEFLAIVERAAVDGVDASVVRDAASLLGWYTTAVFTFLPADRYPHVAAEVVRAIADDPSSPPNRGRGPRGSLQAMFGSRYELPRLRSPVAIQAAIGVVCGVNGFDAHRDPEKVERWARTAAESWFDIYGLCRGERDGMSLVDRLMTSFIDSMLDAPRLHRPLRDVFAARLAEGGTEGAAARVIFAAHPDEPEAVVPAVRSLPATSVRLGRAARSSVAFDELERELERLLVRTWLDSVAGVDVASLLGAVRAIRFVPLSAERKFDVADGQLRIEAASLVDVLGAALGERALALAALYVVHEVVHGAQGLDDKRTVQALRSTGGESALMHLDLAADHASAIIVHHARPTWTVEWLKDLHCEASRAFPLGEHHIAAARARKLGRVISLRVDYLLRAHRLVPSAVLRDGYVFAELGPAGGEFVVLANGPPLRVLGHVSMLGDAADVLARAADASGPSAGEVDATLVPLLRAALGAAADDAAPGANRST